MRGAAGLDVLVLAGGRSAEHGVSCLSGRTVADGLRDAGARVHCVGIDPQGRWWLLDRLPDRGGDGRLPAVGHGAGERVVLVADPPGAMLRRLDGGDGVPLDAAFPVLHGPYGEDGTVQGVLACAGLPYVGADVAASAVGMDKDRMKRAFADVGLPQVPWVAVTRERFEAAPDACRAEVEAALDPPVFTKPARQGSSIGISRVDDAAQLLDALEVAFAHDRVAVVEQGLDGVREVECGVLGNAERRVTRPGEIRTDADFYDFEAKYHRPVTLDCPADVPDEVADACRELAGQAARAVGVRGMARVDLFYDEHAGRLLLNEINTIPGFTEASMFPRLWQAEGVQLPELCDLLVGWALETADGRGGWAP